MGICLGRNMCTLALEAHVLRVKYLIPDAVRTSSCINSETAFTRMCEVYHMFKKNVVDMLIENINEVTEEHEDRERPSMLRKVIQKLRDRPLYKAVDIQRDMLRDHGVRLPYKQAWRGKKLARGILHRCDKTSYDMLLWYASKVTETNPGSIVLIERDGEQFRWGFLCFHASLDGFKKGCRPMLFLDDDNWTWFISKLGAALYGDDEYHDIITFISDRSKGLVNAVAKVFPSAPHGYCLRHLQANFLKSNSQLGKALR
ncbi:uncharacterized protein LOC120271655 [Dioscorea cayenensis subsp. rotundata]|uniref:Uncharacterized protein LOC120271655 n=1 Tax=Dioscorea cayennensis subsp. rotundata TaxID=55577 RepID=A0AB40C528_DIOCR|nr:uncharacterized protein LOC120271655 [Dioscorea cayenensis subsp. rotundata]